MNTSRLPTTNHADADGPQGQMNRDFAATLNAKAEGH